MDHPDLTVSNFMETSIGLKRVNEGTYITVWAYKSILEKEQV